MNANSRTIEPVKQIHFDEETKRLLRQLQRLLTPEKPVEQVKRERDN